MKNRKEVIYHEKSNGYWEKRKFDKNNNRIYYEQSDGYWIKSEFDKNNNEIYYEDSEGLIIDSRPKEIITINGKKYQEI